jgi:hypothetical protein
MAIEGIHARNVIEAAYPGVPPSVLESRLGLPAKLISRSVLTSTNIAVDSVMQLCRAADRIDPVTLLLAMARDRDPDFPEADPQFDFERRLVHRIEQYTPTQVAIVRQVLVELAEILGQD